MFPLVVRATSVSDANRNASRSLNLLVKRVAPVPILVLSNARNSARSGLGRLLQDEGMNAFDVGRPSTISNEALRPYDVVVLEPSVLTAGQATLLSQWVNRGGNLISIRPDRKLFELLGVRKARTGRPDSDLLLDPLFAFGVHREDERIGIRGLTDRYQAAGAVNVASLPSGLSETKQDSAVTLRNVGENGGQAAAFGFDPARPVVSGKKAGLDGSRQLLVNLITLMNADRNLIPRFWQAPEGTELSTGWKHARDASIIRYVNWDDGRQSFWIGAHPEAEGLMAILPVPDGSKVSEIRRNGQTVSFTTRAFKGIGYVWFSALTGDYEVSFTSAAP